MAIAPRRTNQDHHKVLVVRDRSGVHVPAELITVKH
jgi:hypothetical protein